MVEIKNLKKMYGERKVLDIDYLKLEKGESLAVMGANGSGKSTLLKILAGIIRQTEGSFSTEGTTLYAPQNPYALSGTVLENMLIGAKGQKEKAADLLERFNLIELKDKKASSLSGGELQRLSICRLFMRSCSLLLLDEPTSACDKESTLMLTDEINIYKAEQGCTLIISTHSMQLASDTAEKIITLNNGIPE